MVERRIKAATFSTVKSLDSFEFKAIPSLNKVQVLELARCEWIERRENVIALGPSGTGKTHVAQGLGLAECQRGLSVRFVTAAALVHELMEARDERRLLRLQKQFATCRDVEAMVEPLPKVQRNRVLALVSRLFTLFETWEWRPQNTNPARGIERAREEARDRTFSPTELSALAEALRQWEDRHPAQVAAIRLAAVTGLRLIVFASRAGVCRGSCPPWGAPVAVQAQRQTGVWIFTLAIPFPASLPTGKSRISQVPWRSIP